MKVIIGDILGGTVQVNPHITVYHIPILLFFLLYMHVCIRDLNVVYVSQLTVHSVRDEKTMKDCVNAGNAKLRVQENQ